MAYHPPPPAKFARDLAAARQEAAQFRAARAAREARATAVQQAIAFLRQQPHEHAI